MEQELVVVVMGQDCERFLPICLESVQGADRLVYCDGGSSDDSTEIAVRENAEVIMQTFDKTDKTMNGRQRNFYLDYVREHFPDAWCLALDADEVVADLSKIKEFIQNADKGIYSVHMEHFIGDLGHVDATVENHYVPNRLFKISEVSHYPEVEHPVLQGKEDVPVVSSTDCTTIWHLAYIPNLWEIKNRFEQHKAKSDIHTPEFLEQWYRSHVFGQYPRREVDHAKIPDVILNAFAIDPDSVYFANRGVELKHALMVKQWQKHFKPKSVLDLGAGKGPYLYFWEGYCGNKAWGIELSNYAVSNAFNRNIIQGNIEEEKAFSFIGEKDLITAIDVLEHLSNSELHNTLDNMSKYGKRFLFSIPFEGDPNLYNDPTHKQFRSKDEWKKLIGEHGIKVSDAPNDWFFHHQLLIGEKA